MLMGAPLVQPLTDYHHSGANASGPQHPSLTAQESTAEAEESDDETEDGEKLIEGMHHGSYFLSCLRFKPS